MSIIGPSSLGQRDVRCGALRSARFGPPGRDDELETRGGQVKNAVLAMRGKLTDANAKNERLESEVLSKTQQVEQLNTMRASIEEQREALEDEMRVTQRKLAKAERDLQGRDDVIRAGIEGDSRNVIEKRMLRDKLAQEKLLTQESLNRVRALETDLENARGFLDVSEDMQVHFVDRIVEFEGEIEKLKHFEALSTELNREKAVLETDMRYKQNEIDKLQNEVRPELQARLRAAEEALRTLQSENDDLRLRAQAATAEKEQARMIAMQQESEAKQDRYMQQMKDWSHDMVLENVVPDDAASRTQQAAVDKALRFVYSSRPILEKVMIPSDIGHDIFTEHVWKQLADRLGVANATRNDDEACIVDPVELECVDNPAYRMNSMAYNKNTLDGIRKTNKKDPMTRETIPDAAWESLDDSQEIVNSFALQAASEISQRIAEMKLRPNPDNVQFNYDLNILLQDTLGLAKRIRDSLTSSRLIDLNDMDIQNTQNVMDILLKNAKKIEQLIRDEKRQHLASGAAEEVAARATAESTGAALRFYEDETADDARLRRARAAVDRADLISGASELLLNALREEVGFSQDRPTAALLIFRSLLHWRSFEAERTNLFDRIIHMFGAAIERNAENNSALAYWLSNTTTLLYLLHRTLRVHTPRTQSTTRTQSTSQSLYDRVLARRNERSALATDPPAPLREGIRGVRQVDAKYPALLFKQQMTAFVEKVYSLMRDNVRKEIMPQLPACIQAPRVPKTPGGRAGQAASRVVTLSSHWRDMLIALDALLATMRANYVPQILVRKIFTQIFFFINVQLFNSLLLRRECCSFTNGRYVKMGLGELENWVFHAGDALVGSAWDELRFIRQAVQLLVTPDKNKLTLAEIKTDLCPALSNHQLYLISIMYWDDLYGTKTVSQEVLVAMKQQLADDAAHATGQHTSNTFLLDDDAAIPFTVEELTLAMPYIFDISDVQVPPALANLPQFAFMQGNYSEGANLRVLG
jgi:hypothetical protein